MRSLKIQLLLSHLFLVFLMAIVMSGAVVEFLSLRRSIDQILRDNYDSVIAAQYMKETLERQDSAATFTLAGSTQKARLQFQLNVPIFLHWYEVEAHNITEPGEGEMAAAMGREYPIYHSNLVRLLYANPPMRAVPARAFYFGTLEPAFLSLKQHAQDILDVNQKAIVHWDSRAQSAAIRAAWTAAGVTACAVFVALFFAVRIIRLALNPLKILVRDAEEIGAGRLDRRIVMNRSDEIGVLAEALDRMAEKLRDARRLETLRLHRAELLSDVALESLYDPIVVADAAGDVLRVNKAAEGLFGTQASVAGKPLSQVAKDASVAEAVNKAIRQNTALDVDDKLVRLSTGGISHTYRLRATPMRDDDQSVIGAVAVLEDITRLHELDRLKTEFISVASHELRTPVTSLLLAVQLLEEGAAGELSESQRQIVTAQHQDLDRLEKTMRDLLDISKLEAGVIAPKFDTVSVRSLLAAATAEVARQAESAGIALKIDVEEPIPDVRADQGQITRVVLNLLNNALRHTPAGGAVVASAQHIGSKVVISVKDSGEGIPSEYLEHIFEKFVQVPGATRGGAGLGLSIAQSIVWAHGGRIWARSTPGAGSTFSFELDVDDSAVPTGVQVQKGAE